MPLFGNPRRSAVQTVAKRLGASDAQREWARRAADPFERGTAPVNRVLRKQIDGLAARFARHAHKAATAHELQEMTYVVLSGYAYLAEGAEDPHYAPLYQRLAFESRVELDEARLEAIKALL